MHDIQDNLSVKDMSYLTIFTEEQIKKHIRYGI